MSEIARPQPATSHEVDREVVIGEGLARHLPALLRRRGAGTVAVVASERAAASPLGRSIAAALEGAGDLRATWWTDVPPHTSLDVVRRAADALGGGVEALVAVGGGSASDLAKAVAAALAVGDDLPAHFIRRRPDGTVEDYRLPGSVVPVVAVPTTLSAAEVTWGAGVTDAGVKHVLWDPVLAPRALLYETSDLNELPPEVVVPTGWNAVAHCVEAAYSRAGGPVSDALADAGLARLVDGLLREVAAGERSPAVRATLFAGVVLSGQALANARIGLHHALAHVLGAAHGAGHGDLNAVLLSHVADVNRPGSEVAQARSAAVVRDAAARLGVELAAGGLGPALRDLSRHLGAPRTLAEVGVARVDLAATWEVLQAERGLAFNPVPVGPDELRRVLDAAGTALDHPIPTEEEVG